MKAVLIVSLKLIDYHRKPTTKFFNKECEYAAIKLDLVSGDLDSEHKFVKMMALKCVGELNEFIYDGDRDVERNETDIGMDV